jgi:hypothetical protein
MVTQSLQRKMDQEATWQNKNFNPEKNQDAN